MTGLLYQNDAYLKSIRTEVVGCTPSKEGYELVLKETILYPEGGGQPSDHGFVEGRPIKALARRADGTVVHLVDGPVEGLVTVELDWPRRFDHMQQHTGQHLLTAAAFDLYGLNTTAFHLGTERSDIELDCPELSEERIRGMEDRVNQYIRAHLPVSQRLVDPARLDRDRVRSRGLPEGLTGEVRLVEIEGVDINTCGGTHVSNTAELQVMKLLNMEHLRGGTRLYFVAGRRVIHLIREMIAREQTLTKALSCGPEEHASAVDRLMDEARSGEKAGRALLKELAGYIGQELASLEGVASYHRPDGDLDFLKAVAAAACKRRPELLVLLTAGTESGVFLLAGPEERVAAAGKAVAEVLQGRGGGRGGLFQGKASRLDRREEALKLLRV